MERDAVTERFLQYSLERDCKICVVLMTDRQMKKVNLRVTHLDADGFDAVLAGRKKAGAHRDERRAHRRLRARRSGRAGMTGQPARRPKATERIV